MITYEKINDDTIKKITTKEETYSLSEIENNIKANREEIESLENSKLITKDKKLLPAIELFNKDVDRKILMLEGWNIAEDKILRDLRDNI